MNGAKTSVKQAHDFELHWKLEIYMNMHMFSREEETQYNSITTTRGFISTIDVENRTHMVPMTRWQ